MQPALGPRQNFFRRYRGNIILAAVLVAFIGWAVNTHGPQERARRPLVQYNNYKAYMRDLQARIKVNWHPPSEPQSMRAVVLFKILRSGALSSVRIDKSSGNNDMDRAALQAVASSAPFCPLPPGKEANVDIQFTLDYNVHTDQDR